MTDVAETKKDEPRFKMTETEKIELAKIGKTLNLDTLVEMSKKLADKCKDSLKMSEDLGHELEKQLKRIDSLNETLASIKSQMLEAQFSMTLQNHTLYHIFPFLLPNFQNQFSGETINKQFEQSELELEISACVYNLYGKRTKMPSNEKKLLQMMVSDYPDKGDKIVKNMNVITESLYSLRLKSLSIMTELMLQLHEIPKVLEEINELNDKIKKAAMTNIENYAREL